MTKSYVPSPKHEALANPENDRNFKLHVLDKLEKVDKLENKFKIFEYKTYGLVILLVTAKEALIKNFHSLGKWL